MVSVFATRFHGSLDAKTLRLFENETGLGGQLPRIESAYGSFDQLQ